MILGFIINVLAILLNVVIGANFGFSPLTYICIGLNAGVATWCLLQAAAGY